MTRRAVEEWIGRTPDSAIPPRVKLRVFEAHGGICHITGRKITPGDEWDADHILAICNGGENRESNLAPAIREAHRAKTASDVAQKSKDARVRAKHLGVYAPKTRLLGSKSGAWKRRIDGTVERRT